MSPRALNSPSDPISAAISLPPISSLEPVRPILQDRHHRLRLSHNHKFSLSDSESKEVSILPLPVLKKQMEAGSLYLEQVAEEREAWRSWQVANEAQGNRPPRWHLESLVETLGSPRTRDQELMGPGTRSVPLNYLRRETFVNFEQA